MQIIIDVSDVNGYQKRCQDWANRYAIHLLENCQRRADDMLVTAAPTDTFSQRLTRAKEEFTKANPYPTLLPANV
jgi:Ni,Fe-hydrogenase III small subunit